MLRALTLLAIGALSWLGCGDSYPHTDADAFPLVDGAEVVEDWERQDDFGGFGRFLAVAGPADASLEDFLASERLLLEVEGWEIRGSLVGIKLKRHTEGKSLEADQRHRFHDGPVLHADSDEHPDRLRFGPLAEMSKEAGLSPEDHGRLEDLDAEHTILVQLAPPVHGIE